MSTGWERHRGWPNAPIPTEDRAVTISHCDADVIRVIAKMIDLEGYKDSARSLYDIADRLAAQPLMGVQRPELMRAIQAGQEQWQHDCAAFNEALYRWRAGNWEGERPIAQRTVPEYIADAVLALPQHTGQPQEGAWSQVADGLAEALRHMNAAITDDGGFKSPRCRLAADMGSKALDAYLALPAPPHIAEEQTGAK